MVKQRRIPINRLVKPETLSLVKGLAEKLDISEGKVLDRAVSVLASAEAFGIQHVRTAPQIREPEIVPFDDI